MPLPTSSNKQGPGKKPEWGASTFMKGVRYTLLRATGRGGFRAQFRFLCAVCSLPLQMSLPPPALTGRGGERVRRQAGSATLAKTQKTHLAGGCSFLLRICLWNHACLNWRGSAELKPKSKIFPKETAQGPTKLLRNKGKKIEESIRNIGVVTGKPLRSPMKHCSIFLHVGS